MVQVQHRLLLVPKKRRDLERLRQVRKRDLAEQRLPFLEQVVFLQAQPHVPLPLTFCVLVRPPYLKLKPQLLDKLERLTLLEQLKEKLDEEPVRVLSRQFLLQKRRSIQPHLWSRLELIRPVRRCLRLNGEQSRVLWPLVEVIPPKRAG